MILLCGSLLVGNSRLVLQNKTNEWALNEIEINAFYVFQEKAEDLVSSLLINGLCHCTIIWSAMWEQDSSVNSAKNCENYVSKVG